MEDTVFQSEFGRDRIVPIALAQQHARFGILRIRITALNHKVLNHTMEQKRIKRSFRHQHHQGNQQGKARKTKRSVFIAKLIVTQR